MTISIQEIKLIREKTGAGIQNCKKALIEMEGNFEKAIELLRQKGLASAEKKVLRTTKQGLITSYIHTGSKLGVLVELNCESDFVARRIEFQHLAKNLAMQIAANASINYISLKDIPSTIWDQEMKLEEKQEDIQKKPENIKASIIKGRVEKTLKNFTLLDQPCLQDPDLKVEDYIKNHIYLLGENIQLARFCKFIVGENFIKE